jgi:PAS domain S-box-containing protein
MDASSMPSAEALLDALPDAVLFLDPDGTITGAAAQLSELGGWERPQLVGRPVSDLFPDDQRENVLAELRRWWDTGASALARRTLRMSLPTPAGDTAMVGLRIHRADRGFSVTVRRLGAAGGDLRAALLEAVSAPVVTASAVGVAGAEIGRSYAWDLSTVWVVDTVTVTLRAVTVWERDPDSQRRHRSATLRQPFLPGEGLPGRAWESGEVLVVGDVSGDPRFGTGYGTNRRPQTAAMVPLRTGHRIVGVLELFAFASIDPSLWLESESEAIATGLGQLVERFRDRMQADAVEGRLALALDAGELGVWSLDVRSGRAQWSSRMAELHGVDECEGVADSVFARVVADDRATVGHALARAREVDDPQTVAYRLHDPDRGTTWLSTRITRVQTEGGPPLLSAVSSDVTESKRAELSAQRRRAAIEGLQWVSQAIIAGRRLADTAVAVAHAATGVLGADVGVLLYPEPGDVGSALAWAVSGLLGDQPVPDPPSHLEIQSIVRTATGVEVIRDLPGSPEVRRFVSELGLPLEGTQLRSAMLVPIGGERGRPLGLMVFLHADRSYFTADDARLAASIGSSTGIAIENAHRHEEQRLAASTFQRQLLPPTDADVAGVELCGRYHPGRDGLDVGGDWYDVIRVDDHRVGLAVGDVCGHGVTAAAHMGQLRFSFRALVHSSSPPEEAVQVLNRIALDELHTTATLAYVELDTRTGACRAWNCGHLPPVVAGGDGAGVRWIDDLSAAAPMLGFLPSVEPRPIEFALEADDLLVLYTDGLVERRGESIDDGLDRLAKSLLGRAGPVASVCDDLYGALAEVGPEADDTVLLAVRRT